MNRVSTLQRTLRLAMATALASSGAVALSVAAQSAPASSGSAAQPMTSMNMGSMDMGDMDMGNMPMPASASSTKAPAAAKTSESAKDSGMAGMSHGGMSSMDHAVPATANPSSHSSPSKSSKEMGDMDMGDMPMPAGAAHHSGKGAGTAQMRQGSMPDKGRVSPAPAASSTGPAHATHPQDTGNMDMSGMDMRGMAMPGGTAPPVASGGSGHAMQDGDMAGMDHGAMSDKNRAQSGHDKQGKEAASMSGMSGMSQEASGGGDGGMSMGAMQGGSAPPDARSPDYSDGVGYGDMPGMDMTPPRVGRLLLDNFEAVHGRDGNGQAWELQGWYGGDVNKLWLRSEGERNGGRVEDGSAEVLWNHLIATYWSTQLGVRRDIGVGPGRTWGAFGVEGLAPYFFDVEATAYVGQSGRTAARFRATYDVLITQRLILTPEFELNAYGKGDPARKIGAGVSDASLGLRLRYEIRREFAPYIGVNWVRRFGATAGYARRDHQPVFDPQIVAGVRIWF